MKDLLLGLALGVTMTTACFLTRDGLNAWQKMEQRVTRIEQFLVAATNPH